MSVSSVNQPVTPRCLPSSNGLACASRDTVDVGRSVKIAPGTLPMSVRKTRDILFL